MGSMGVNGIISQPQGWSDFDFSDWKQRTKWSNASYQKQQDDATNARITLSVFNEKLVQGKSENLISCLKEKKGHLRELFK
jgi:hypothetical protein